MDENLSSKRYEPVVINLENKNHSHTLIIESTGFNKIVLEIGTSTGYISKVLKERGNRVTGIEIDEEAGLLAQEYCERMIIGDVEKLTLDEFLTPASFDVIICGDVLEHLKKPATVLKKIRKFLKQEGYLVVSLPNFCHGDVLLNLLNGDFHYTPMGLLDETHLHFFGLKNIYSVFADCGFQIKDLQTTNYQIGNTELKVDDTEIPRDLLKFIESLPDSSVYQYIFSAYPSDCVTLPDIKEGNLKQLFFDSLQESRKEIQIPLETNIDSLNQSLAERETHLQEKIRQIEELEESAVARRNQIADMNAHVQSLELAEVAKNQHIADMNAHVQSLELAEAAKNQHIADMNAHVQSLELAEAAKNQHIADMNAHVQSLELKLSSIEKSIVWQFTMKFHHKVVERLLPQNTRRRRYYDRGRAGGKILTNNGCRAFYQSICRYLHNNNQLDDCRKLIKQNEDLPRDLSHLKKICQNFSYRPKISIITPVWNTNETQLRYAVESVINQVYDNWELCIVDGGSTKRYIKPVLDGYAQKNPRIKIKFLTENKGISENSNEALSIATGEFIGFLDHDDELTPFALYEVIKLLNQRIDAEVIYSDEDKITNENVFCEPFYKPDWSPEYFRGVMYMGHLLILRKSLLEKVGLFDKTFDFIQDYEFMLRVSEKTQKIYHIPKVLYHWRKTQGSIALSTDSKGDISEKQVSAVNAHLRRLNLPASAHRGPIPHRVIIKPFLRSDYPLVSIIIPTKNKPELIERCLKSINGVTTYPHFEVIIIDNNSTDPDAKKIIDSYPCKKISFMEEFNFSKVNNLGAMNANGDYLIFLNNDTEIHSGDWIQNMLYYAEQEDIAAVGPLLKFPDNTVQHAGVVLGFRGTADHIMRNYPVDCDGYAGSLTCAREVSAVTAACMMVKKSLFWDVGGFNEHYSIIYQDVDLCLKFISRGYRIIVNPRVVITHYECSTRDKYGYDFIDRNLLLDQWSEIIENGDKYYNKNFDLTKYGRENTGYTIKEKEAPR